MRTLGMLALLMAGSWGPGIIPRASAAPVAVHVNQTGYLPGLTKRATIVDGATAPSTWRLRNSAGVVVASGQTIVRGADAASGDSVHIADFSAFTTPGSGYRLSAGNVTSVPFDIRADLYRPLKYDALAYFYHNRSGIPITMPFAGGSQWTRPAGHLGVAPNRGDTSVPCAAGTGCTYSLDVRGGWYDAGDHGKYVVNGGISLWTLLNLYERMLHLSPSSAGDFADGTMNIPENANGVSDLLDEARWQMLFHLRMQVPPGRALAGMAHHKMHDVNWTGFPMRPDRDPQPRVLRPPSTAATLNLAANAAQCARIWQPIDSAFSARCLTAARRAWPAARANPNRLAPGSDGTGGGSYGDGNVSDEFFWAAAELYITTGEATYRTFVTQSPFFNRDVTGMHWGGTQALGAVSLAVVPNGLGADGISSVRNRIVNGARAARATVQGQGYGVPITSYPWGSSSSVLNVAIILALGYEFTGDRSYLQAVVQSMDYILGRNALDKSYVSGYGENPLRNPHHRFWARQVSASSPPPPRGALSGGPNASPSDPTARAALGGCRPQRCYIDNLHAYSVNEVTINWNAPLAWVAAFLDDQGGN